MDFRYTPEEAQSIAARLLPYLTREGLSVKVEASVAGDAPFGTTLLARGSRTVLAIECQGRPAYLGPLRELVGWLAVRRMDAEVFIATSTEAEVTVKTLSDLRSDGVGLMVIHPDESVEIALTARNPALAITVDRSLSLGRCKTEIIAMERRFNQGDRRASLRDLCDLVERETAALARRAAAKGWIGKTVADIDAMNWSSCINTLAATSVYAAGRAPLVDARLKDDLHSFRGARNLVDHPARNRREDLRRQRQFGERMLMGSRLVAELLPLQRTVT